MTLELKGVTKRVGAETHIYGTDLKLADTGFNVLLGATGAGKTTLIKIMAGLEQINAGEIWLGGRNVTGVSPQKRNVSLVHQFFVNYPHMTVFENIASPLRIAGMSSAEIDQRVGETAELLRLTPMLGRHPAELSGGQQQRTALARALAKDAAVVLLDEPLANLDYKLREELRDELPRLLADRGAIVVYATSEPAEALLLGGHTATMREGQVTQFGPTAELYRRPMDLPTAEIFSDPPMNTARVEKRDGAVKLSSTVAWPASGAISDHPDGAYLMGVRPNFVSPSEESAHQVRIDGCVLVTELSGSESVAHFELGRAEGGGTWVSQSHGIHPYKVGEQHGFFIDVSRCLYFDETGARLGG
ncbi:MAG: ABC transporter ATP-binding protein [Pseudomonadota bacterium]